MALTPCPKCGTKLKLPDGATAAVRCPKCQTVFSPPKSAPAQPAFEVVEDEPAPQPARPAAARPAPAKPSPPQPPRPAPTPAKPAKAADDFEVVDDQPAPPPKKRVVAREDDDDSDDRPRKKSRREDDEDDRGDRRRRRDRDDEDDDRPRGRRRERDRDRDDEDDYYDDRPRKKRRDYDDEDPYDRPRVRGAGAAKFSLLMSLISLGLYLVTFGLISLFVFLSWVGVGYIPLGAMIIPGLLGLANWVVGGVGIGFAIAGPPRARGLAIAAAAVSVVHIALTFVIANNTEAGMFSDYTTQYLGLQSKHSRMERLAEEASKNPSDAKAIQKEMEQARKDLEEFDKDYRDELKDILYYGILRASKESKDVDQMVRDPELRGKAPTAMRWQDVASLLPFADQLIVNLAYHGKTFGEYVLPMLGGLTEVARLVLLVLLIGSLSKAVKGHEAADKAKYGLISVCVGFGVALLIALFAGVMIDSAQSDLKKTIEGALTGADIGRMDQGSIEKRAKDIEEKIRSAQSSMKTWTAMDAFLIPLIYAGMVVLPAIAALQGMAAASRAARR